MSYISFRKSSIFRSRHGARLLTAWIAILVQLHIFLVLELHHHVLGSRFLRDAATASASLTKSQTAPAPAPLCPACRIARQGSVQPAAEGLALLLLPAATAPLPASPSNAHVVFLLHPSGRDPPRV